LFFLCFCFRQTDRESPAPKQTANQRATLTSFNRVLIFSSLCSSSLLIRTTSSRAESSISAVEEDARSAVEKYRCKAGRPFVVFVDRTEEQQAEDVEEALTLLFIAVVVVVVLLATILARRRTPRIITEEVTIISFQKISKLHENTKKMYQSADTTNGRDYGN
jgi:hypothetical protein